MGESYLNSIFLNAITINEVARETDNSDANKSPSYDKISLKVVKAISKHIIEPLTHIYNQSIVTGIIPSELKVAVVTPIFKSNDKESYSNYRPMSVLPCFTKILEKLMYKRVIKFLDKHNILSESQFGFRKKLSRNLSIMELVERISKAIDDKEYTMGVFLDL